MNKYLTTKVAKKTQRAQMLSIPNKDGILWNRCNALRINEASLLALIDFLSWQTKPNAPLNIICCAKIVGFVGYACKEVFVKIEAQAYALMEVHKCITIKVAKKAKRAQSPSPPLRV